MPDVTSRHLRGTTELLLMFPLKSGFVQTSVRPLSYASRLRALLQATFALRQGLTERELGVAPGAIERLETILSTQWTVVEAERKLLVSVVFDRSWEEYAQTLVDETGDSLDSFFMHCEGYTGFSGRDGHQAFSRWLRDHQIPCDLFYTAAPELTVDDLDCLKKQAAKEPTPLAAAALQVGRARERARELTTERAKRDAAAAGKEDVKKFLEAQTLRRTFQALTALQELAWMYPRADEAGAPPSRAENRRLTAREVFNAAVWNIVPFVGSAYAARSEAPQLKTWLEELKCQQDAEGPALHRRTAAWQRKPRDVFGDVQGNILRPYKDMNVGCIALIRCDGPAQARSFLENMTTTKITFERKAAEEPGELHTNLFLTYPGLVRLGLPESQLAQFPKEFREGPEPRAGLIGDVGKPNHPDYWELPLMNGDPQNANAAQRVRLSSVDFVVCMQKQIKAPKSSEWTKDHPLATELSRLSELGGQVLHVQTLLRQPAPGSPEKREHFGLVDDVVTGSQPIPDLDWNGGVRGKSSPPASPHTVRLGELLLGYPDQRGPTESSLHENPLLDNGSFLVLRKLEQDVAAFNAFASENAKALGVETRDVIASIVGRNHAGNSLITPDNRSNEFDYEQDKTGSKCPLSSHVRLANPREPQHDRPPPRIMRRGFSYGTRYTSERDAKESRGLMFMAYNSSIARQYEVIQRWLNAGNITGLLSSQNDVLTGGPQSFDGPRWAHVPSTDKRGVPLKVDGPFVSVKWGMYLFAPSRSCLFALAKGAPATSAPGAAPPRDPALVTEGTRIIRSLESLASACRPAAREAWKQLIEEATPLQRARSKAVWETIRGLPGAELRTPYGILKAGRQQARSVLSDDGSNYSAHAYKERFHATLGDHYLSWDPIDPATSQVPTYAAQSEAPRAYFANITQKDAHDSARALARRFLAQPELAVAGQPGRGEIGIEVLATAVTALWAQEWLGLLPNDNVDDPEIARRFGSYQPPLAGLVSALNRFVLASKYTFFPFPERAVEREAQQAWPDERRRDLGVDPNPVLARGKTKQPELAASCARLADAPNLPLALAGGIVGFAAPAIGATLSIFDQWIESEQLWHIAATQRADEVLPAAILRALLRAPVPPILYRASKANAEPGHEDDEDRVVVGLGSACDEEPGLVTDHEKWKWLFGGASGPPGPNVEHHACPARSAALGFLMGVASALLEQPNLTRERRLVLSFDRQPPAARIR